MKFFAEILRDPRDAATPPESVFFELEAASAHDAFLILNAYVKGLFEGSGKGADITYLSDRKVRGREYRRL